MSTESMDVNVQMLKSFEDDFSRKGFKEQEHPNLHFSESIRFAKTYFKLSERQESTLLEGIKFDFFKLPEAHFSENNSSTIKHLHLVRPIIKEWVEKGTVSELNSPAHCSNPLSTIIQDRNGKTKVRICLDLSRHVNPCLINHTVKLDDLEIVKSWIAQGDYLVSWDLEGMYHLSLIHISEPTRPY